MFYIYKLTQLANKKMDYLLNRTFASTNTYYSKQKSYEIWAHLQSQAIIIQCRIFLPEGITKLYTKSISSISNQQTLLNHQNIFLALINQNSTKIDLKKGILWLDIYKQKKQYKTQIKLQQKLNEPSFDNWMIIKLIDEKIKKLPKLQQKIFYEMVNQNQLIHQIEPIFHQNQQYRFSAQMDVQNRKINTQLIVKQRTSDNKFKQKAFKSAIKEKDWENQYSQRFKNLETLFQHLRNPNNYQVLYSKGVIRIKYDSDLSLDLKHMKTDRTNSSNKSHSNMKRFRLRSGTNQFNQKQMSIDKDLSLNKQLDQFGKKLQNKMITKIKQSQKQIVVRQRQQIDKVDDKLDVLQKELRTYFKKKLKQEIQKINKSIEIINRGVIQAKIQIQKSETRSHQKHKIFENMSPSSTQRNRSTSLSKSQDHKIQINTKSQYINKFKITPQNNIQYVGSWDWTQLFTQNSIQFNQIYRFKFKIIQSFYNAIAIGISESSNCLDRSSLTKPNSVSYWGDGQIWQGHKLKQEGKGFKQGDIVVMQVNRNNGEVNWQVNNISMASHRPLFLRNKQLNIFVYIEMYDQNDKLQLVSYTKN